MKEDKLSLKSWDMIANAYQKRYQITISPIVYSPFGPMETELNLLGKKKNKKIIDIGAGGCQKAIYLSKHGAKMTAFDISRKQLEYGKMLASENHVSLKFVRGDFQFLSSYFPRNHFDIAYSIFALQYAKNINVLKKVFSEIYKILKPNGIFVLSLDHPLRNSGFWDTKNDKFIFDNYFDKSEHSYDYAFPESKVSGKFRGSYWTISDLINSLIASKFKLEKIIEPIPIKRKEYFDKFGLISRYGVNNKKDPFNFKNLTRIPGTIIIKMIK